MVGAPVQYVGPNAVYPGLPTQTGLQKIIPAYVYQQFADDDNIRAFNDAQNGMATQFLLWFNTLNLPIYTGGIVAGALLDWVANGLYGVPRPSITTGTIRFVGATNTAPTDVVVTDGRKITSHQSLQSCNDDIYRRVITWNFYKGDGFVFNIQWLKRRVLRFLNGPNGIAPTIDNTYSISVAVTGTTIAITVNSGDASLVPTLNALIQSGACTTPFQFSFSILYASGHLYNDGGVLGLTSGSGWPASPTSLGAGAFYSNGGVATALAGGTLNPAAPPVVFGAITAAALLLLNAGDLWWTAPTPGSGMLWLPGGVNGGDIWVA